MLRGAGLSRKGLRARPLSWLSGAISEELIRLSAAQLKKLLGSAGEIGNG
ncbi:MAG: hypothetical protein U0Q18_29665 [Bryobacteraceae bacterium]